MRTFPTSEGIDHYLIEMDTGIFQSSRGPAQDDNILGELGITDILSITSVSLKPTKLARRWIYPIDDNLPWPHDSMVFVLRFFHHVLEVGGRALVHCDHGRSRSTGAMILYRMRTGLGGRDEAAEWVRNKNPRANVHPDILASFPDRLI